MAAAHVAHRDVGDFQAGSASTGRNAADTEARSVITASETMAHWRRVPAAGPKMVGPRLPEPQACVAQTLHGS